MSCTKIAAIGGAFFLLCGCATTHPIVHGDETHEAAQSAAPAPTPTQQVVTTTGADMPASTEGAAAAKAATDGVSAFDRRLATKLVGASVERAKTCAAEGGPTGKGRAVLTFSTDGKVTDVVVDAPFNDTDVGRCVIGELQQVFVNPFSGEAVTVGKSFEIPAPQPSLPSSP